MSSRPVSVLTPLPIAPNIAMVYRTCRDCLMEVSWPMKQTSLDRCPYCDVRYQRPTRRQERLELAGELLLRVVVCAVIALAVGMLVNIGKRLFL